MHSLKSIVAISLLSFAMFISAPVLHAAPPSWLPSCERAFETGSRSAASAGAARLVRSMRGRDLACLDLGSSSSADKTLDSLDVALGPTDFYCRTTCPWQASQISASSALLATGTGWNRPLGMRLTLRF